MIKAHRIIRLLAILAVAGTALLYDADRRARAEELVTDLSDHLIAIESNFTGAEILLFGAVEADSSEIRALAKDIVVVLRGPAETLVVRRKQRKLGIWLNAQSRSYKKVPSYYAVVSTRPLALIASSDVLERHRIGLSHLKIGGGSDGGRQPVKAEKMFQSALIRLKVKDRLYRETSDGVLFLGDTLFRAKIALPANVQAGYYTAEVFLFRNGRVLHAQTSPLYINKSGFERFVYNLAQRQPALYGILAVLCALFAGWLAAVLLRRG
jgi:uncharacterized protein (TIGR02186 family)